MRIAILEDWFSEQMGYAESCLAKALAAEGEDVHVVTSDAQVYFNAPFYRDVYEPYLGPPIVPLGERRLDGYTLHRLPHTFWHGRLRIRGLGAALRSLKPAIVQTFNVTTPAAWEAAAGRLTGHYRLFTGAHLPPSVFPLARDFPLLNWKGRALAALRWHAPGRAVSLLSERCYAVTPDAAGVAIRFLGVPASKVEVAPLGVDTDLFYPPGDEAALAERRESRGRLGFGESDIVCVYTGRFTPNKNPACLAAAIAGLRVCGEPFRGLFIGDGPQAESLQASDGCVIRPFMPFYELPAYYRAADVGVWPMEESTSMLDAAGSGLALVTNERLHALDHLAGGWIPYHGGDVEDMMRALREVRDPERRRQMGEAGANVIRRDYSWRVIARRRLADYRAAVAK